MSRPELSVVIVSYRCADLLDECLTSLAANRADVDMEVEVVDNASGDGTMPVIVFSFLPRAANEGIDVTRSRVYGLAGPRSTSAARPASTI